MFSSKKQENQNIMSVFKRPKTQRQRKDAAKIEEYIIDDVFLKHKTFVRVSARNVPNHWDDKVVEKQRSWKKHRKTRYK